MKTDSIKKNIVLSTIYQIFLILAPLVTAPYISRVLGPEVVGIRSYTTTIQIYFSLFASLGTLTYGVREIARARDNKKAYSKIFWEIEGLCLITSAIVLVPWGAMSFLYKRYQIYFLILTLNILVTAFDISWLYAGLEKFKYTIIVNLIFRTLGIILVFVLVKNPSDLWLYMLILGASTLLGTLSMWMFLPRFLTKTEGKIRPFSHLKQTLVYFIPTIAISFYTILDKVMIGALISGTYEETVNGETFIRKISNLENGYYEQASKINSVTSAITFVALNTVMASRISYLFKEEKFAEIKSRIQQSMDYILFVGIGVCFGVIGVAGKFVPLFFGEGYDKVVILMMMFSPISLIIGISNCLETHYYTPAGLRKESGFYLIIGAIVNLIVNVPLIYFLKSYGAAIASLIAELTISIIFVARSKGYMSFKYLLAQSWRKAIAGFLMLGFIFLINKLNIGRFLALFIDVTAGILIYYLALFLMRDAFAKRVFEKTKSLFKKRNIQ